MKLFRILPLVVGSAAAGILASTSPAHALDFNFTFTDNTNTVGGTIYGLTNNAISAASDITIDSASNATQSFRGSIFSAPNTGQSTYENSFTVSSGSVTSASFNFSSFLVIMSLGTQTGDTYNFYQNNNAITYNTGGFAGATYSSADVPFDIPGGATIPAVGGLLALGLMRKARKSIASKTCIANFVTATVS